MSRLVSLDLSRLYPVPLTVFQLEVSHLCHNLCQPICNDPRLGNLTNSFIRTAGVYPKMSESAAIISSLERALPSLLCSSVSMHVFPMEGEVVVGSLLEAFDPT